MLDFDAVATMLMVIADGVWWRRALEPEFDARGIAADLHGYHASHVARVARSDRVRAKERLRMKASRITAVGLVAAAAGCGSRPAILCRTRPPKAAPRIPKPMSRR